MFCTKLAPATLVLLAATLAGGTASAAVGGPDAFGYRYVDQNDGAEYNYVDISGTGSVVIDDQNNAEATADFPVGVTFDLYGSVESDIVVSSNGFLSNVGGGSDATNDCPPPAMPSGGGGDRLYVLHDDLVTTAYYEYFDADQAGALGFPHAPNGVSIIQWVGTYFGIGGSVDFQAVLFHGTSMVLYQYAIADDTGSGSTTGTQNAAFSTGLDIVCDSGLSITPGSTAFMVFTHAPVRINEIRVDQSGTDDLEFIELAGPPGFALDGLFVIGIGDSAGSIDGHLEEAFDLDGESIQADGFFSLGRDTLNPAADLVVPMDLSNNDNVTFALVTEFTGSAGPGGDDTDADDDCVPDSTPWDLTIDVIANIEVENPPTPMSGENCHYGPDTGLCTEASETCGVIGPNPDPGNPDAPNPWLIYRCPDLTGAWNIGANNPAAGDDTPGSENACNCGDGEIVTGEDCDDGGESATCDDDCTFVACGDFNSNETAGEECDDGFETASCDEDCTFVICGDSTTNEAAGEECDDGGESATCDDDCSFVVCGDSNTNEAAGEECDDGGESATCDDDCSLVVCGDLYINATAGEECDDGGETEDCDDDCTEVVCGDGNTNATAGEECDDGGESEDCDDDCTMAVCGDGQVNKTAGEVCDDGEKTDTCNEDCTSAMCGDGYVNAEAGEECDEDGETEDCDDDCTMAECGDGTVNATAGEECDDNNSDDGDGCSADCMTEEDPDPTDTDTGGASTTGGEDESGEETGESATEPPETSGIITVTATATDTDTDTDGSGGALPEVDGCDCRSGGRVPAWAIFALAGIIGVRRRRSTRVSRP